ncbi:MAG: response regulator [Jaaginema sp. PMC 1079.18]|nr:response regulator [Jaaginema sp. PMC 1080.18]MEC4850333.1 response regulator [Jaaginema sp. PMC 1079.18]MEC4865586.1 response regulator [Jaaginema sp. PMC 1078.18]
MRLLLVEDDEVQAHTIKQALIAQGYVVDGAADGEEGWDFIEAFTYDLMLLDVSLPKLDGITLCRRVRDRGDNVPILLLTARSSSTDKVAGLDAGADDYVVKPCTGRELFARIRALLRRRNASSAPLLTWDKVTLDPSSRELFYDGQPIALSPKEYNLLELFLRNPRRVLTHSAILEHLWSFEDPPSEGTVRAHIKRLRHKLKKAGVTEMIETIYGVGYRLKEAKPPSPPEIPASPPQDTTKANLQAIWEKFRPQILGRLQPLRDAIAASERHSLSHDLAATAANTAHKLAGSLGIFGLKTGYSLAQTLEEELKSAIAATPENHFVTLTPDSQQHCQTLIAFVEQAEYSSISTPHKVRESPTAAPLTRAPSHLLIVDDDCTLLQNFKTAALNWNFTVAVASSISTAQNAIAQQLPDLVLLDIVFPDDPLAGLNLLADLKSRYPHLPIVIFSAYDRLRDRVAACSLSSHPHLQGGDAFLSKLISLPEVMTTIAEMLKPIPPHRAKILVVDDDLSSLDYIEQLLNSWELTPIVVSDPRLFWENLETHAPDLLILDYKMPYYDGLQLCRIVRNDPTWQSLPIVFITAETQPTLIQTLYQNGADDYIAKPFREAELATRIFNRLERVKLLRDLADTDVLTGLANRRRGSRDINRYLRLCQRHQQLFSLIMLDVNDFKPINDRYGHGVGDRVLRQLGTILQQQFRQEDITARWGGDEFVIGLYATQKKDATQRAQQLLDCIKTTPIPIAGQVQLQLVLSMGVATYPEDGADLPSLYAVADTALYHAKATKV